MRIHECALMQGLMITLKELVEGPGVGHGCAPCRADECLVALQGLAQHLTVHHISYLNL